MSNLIAVEGLTFSSLPSATIAITIPITSNVITIEGKKPYHSITVSATIGAFSNVGTFDGTSIKAKGVSFGIPASFVLDGDSIIIEVPTTPTVTPVTVTIDDAGQSTVRVN